MSISKYGDKDYASTCIDPKDINHIIWIYDFCRGMSWEKLSVVC